MPLEPLTSYTWPTDRYPLASLSVRVDNLAARLGIEAHAWQVDGLGPARGFGGRLPSGRVILVEELEYGRPYPAVWVDAAELSTFGPDALVAEVCRELGLTPPEIVRVAGNTERLAATELTGQVIAARAQREPKKGQAAQ